ncbi:glycosyltransferase family 4 protein [Geomonas sp. RF6]|uniref:glycosyltransferase family 4 protein n=1 Tax=Geomonas sp. RF6 TaxID=2897342 RepID=UPI001E289A3C|nr:glycosyltransferase family 4 protein [Geomonas sp. RF6]UFS72704.1 glycosyltransferase family 4 protein [Geomonas sp. RF6]
MKILHTVEFYHPSVGGMQEVVKQLSERLVRLGHEVTVATTSLAGRTEKVVNGVRIEEFAVAGKLALGITGDVERYRTFVRESRFDVVTNFAAQQWTTDAMITMLDQIDAKKVFVPTGFSELSHPRFQSYFAGMRQWLTQYDMNVFLSNDYRDIDFARDCGVTRIRLIPNGASEDEFLPPSKIDIRTELGIPRDHFLILHVGSHTGLKGHAEAMRIFAHARIRNATLLVAANDFGGGCATACKLKRRFFNAWPPRRQDGKRIIVTSLPRQETVAAYQAADAFLFPSNIECSPLVLFECMASSTPFLTTDVGNAREIVEWSGGGRVLPTTKDRKGRSHAEIAGSVAMLEELYRDGTQRGRMAQAGFAAWQERFTWGNIAREYEKLYMNLLKG